MLGIFVAGLAEERDSKKFPKTKFRKRSRGKAPVLDMRFKGSREFATLDRFFAKFQAGDEHRKNGTRGEAGCRHEMERKRFAGRAVRLP
jgi:hypothetical protein